MALFESQGIRLEADPHTRYYGFLVVISREGDRGARRPVARKRAKRAIFSGSGVPAGLYRFVDLASFTEDWASLRLGEEERRALENEIARDPVRAPVVSGGGGVRKIRRPDLISGKGKSGGYRVLYAFLPNPGIVLLIAAWPKSEREDLERDDYKAIARSIDRIRTLVEQGKIR